MFYFAWAVILDIASWHPVKCVINFFCWPKANEVLEQECEHEEGECHIPETIEEMRKLIHELKADKED